MDGKRVSYCVVLLGHYSHVKSKNSGQFDRITKVHNLSQTTKKTQGIVVNDPRTPQKHHKNRRV